jgi:hypothetical protein
MLRCAASFVVAAYPKVRLTPQDLPALSAAFLQSRPNFDFLRGHQGWGGNSDRTFVFRCLPAERWGKWWVLQEMKTNEVCLKTICPSGQGYGVWF